MGVFANTLAGFRQGKCPHKECADYFPGAVLCPDFPSVEID
jgi:hypothetical protein